MESGGKIKFAIFGVIVIIIIIGGFYLMKKSEKITLENKVDNKVIKEEKESKDIRIDKTKEYIYYTNYERVVDELDIEYKDIVFNFEGHDDIAKSLNEETKTLKESLVYDEEAEDIAYDKLQRASYKQYEFIIFDDFISLIVRYYNFTKDDLVSFERAKTYVFSKESGKILSEEELLQKYNLSFEDARWKIKTYVSDQNLLKEGEELDADATVINLTELNLFVDKLGKLNATVLVKSDQKDYNDNIRLS